MNNSTTKKILAYIIFTAAIVGCVATAILAFSWGMEYLPKLKASLENTKQSVKSTLNKRRKTEPDVIITDLD